MLTQKQLRKGLKTRLFGKRVFSFETIDSTNACAKSLSAVGTEEGAVIIAEEQTSGRGRLGRAWLAKPKENLTFSIILRPTLEADALNLLPLYVAVAVAEAVERVTNLKPECKWPNDLLLHGKKFCGILIEGSQKGAGIESVIIGIGINVNQRDFPEELKSTATSLGLELGTDVDRVKLLQAVLTSLERLHDEHSQRGFQEILPSWQSRATMMGKTISVFHEGTVFSGLARGLNADGALILQVGETERLLYAGDVSIKVG